MHVCTVKTSKFSLMCMDERQQISGRYSIEKIKNRVICKNLLVQEEVYFQSEQAVGFCCEKKSLN